MVPDLVTVGGLTVDNVIASDGRVALAQAGGNGAYAAAGALMWRSRVGLVSCAPASYPAGTIARLEAQGVDLAGVAWAEAHPTACNWFIYDGEGRREEGLASPPEALAEAGFSTDHLNAAQVVRWRALLAARGAPDETSYSGFRDRHPLTPAQVPEAWRRARGVHLAPSRLPVMLEMATRFASGGVKISADPGWQLAAHTLDDLAPLLARLDAFLPSEVELSALVPGTQPGEGLARIAALCPGAVAVKLGPRGALVWDRDAGAPVAIPAIPVRTVDPTGAGDSFCGGFLAGLIETGDAVAAARFGVISAARVVGRFGADGALPPDRAANRALLAGGSVSCPL